MGVGGEERGHDVRADIGGNAGQQERGGLRGDAQIGGGQAHNNLQPYIVANYMFKVL